jgi:hypothetical protein
VGEKPKEKIETCISYYHVEIPVSYPKSRPPIPADNTSWRI